MIETRNTKKLYFTLLEWYSNLGPALRFNIVAKIYCLMQFLACVLEEIRQFWIDSWSPLLIAFSVSAQSETFEGGDDQQDAGSPSAERISRAFDVSLQWPRVSMAIALLNLLPLSPDIRLSKSFNVGWNKTLLYIGSRWKEWISFALCYSCTELKPQCRPRRRHLCSKQQIANNRKIDSMSNLSFEGAAKP